MKRLICSIVSIGVLLCFTMDSPASANQNRRCDMSQTWQYKGVNSMEENQTVKHYTWELAVPPYGPLDKIALHRMVDEPRNQMMIPNRPAPDRREVIFIIPGTFSNGYAPSGDPDLNINMFLAVNGYDVYSMDFRTSYIPNHAYHQFAQVGIDISSTGTWTYDLFREDIKACVDKTKSLSGARKIFLGGISRGVTQMWLYALKYPGDVKGLIGMDGAGIKSAPIPGETRILAEMTPEEITVATDAYNFAMAEFRANGHWLSEVGGYETGKFAALVPLSASVLGFSSIDAFLAYFKAAFPMPIPDPPTPVTNVTELGAYTVYWGRGPGVLTNVYTPYPGGNGETYMDPDVLNFGRGQYTRYWPNVQDLETSAAFGGGGLDRYDDCPFLDYDDHWQEIDVPVLFFNGEFTCPGTCAGTSIEYTLNNLATADVTMIHLDAYGHLDVFYGTHSREDMKEPLLGWLSHRK